MSLRPTMKDVARAADVGVGTVSRVLNDHPNVSRASRERVLDAITSLGYRRNSAAGALRRGAGVSIGLLVEDVADPFYSQLNRAIEDEALRQDWTLLTVSSAGDSLRARRHVENLRSRGVDGLILTVPDEAEESWLVAEAESGVPLVFVDRPSRTLAADTVLTDNRGGARLAVEHLIARGHTRIACLTDRAGLYTARERVAGYRDALEAHGLDFDDLIVHADPDGRREVAPELARMLALDAPPTAVFSANNRMSVVVLREMRRGGFRLEMVGFDDLELGDLLDPPLTVVAQDPDALGAAAMSLLEARIAGGEHPARTVLLPPRLIVRS
ncbi:MAG: LacI family DNA-binding transcriptional regulator [Microbacteriaceae bacterium]